MEQPYWASIHDNLADSIQFVENHGEVTESIEGPPQRPAKKRRKFSHVLNMQIRIPVPHSPTSPARPSPPPPLTVVDDSQFESAEFQMSPPSHPTPAAP